MSTAYQKSESYGKRFLSSVAILAISTFIVKIIGMFYKIPMMELLGAEGMGYFNSAYEIYSLFFVISTTGIPVAISILVSENKASKKYSNIKKIYKISLIILGVIGAIGTLILALFFEKAAALINNEQASMCIIAISPTLLMICLSSAMRGYFQGNEIMIPTAVSQVIEALGKLLLGLGFATLAIKKGYEVPKVAAFAILGITIGVAASLLYLALYNAFYRIKEDKLCTYSVEKTSSIFKKLIYIAFPITISSTILSLTKLIDMIMILTRLGSIGYTQIQANSIYGSYSTMAISIYNLPATLVSAIALPLVPMLSGAIESNDISKEKFIINSALKLVSIVALPAGLGISVFGIDILKLLFASQSEEIEYTAPLLSILGLSVFLSSMITVTNAILQSYKMVKNPIISMTVGTLIKVALAFVLIGIPRINIYGAPISTFFSTAVIVTLNLYFIVKRIGRIGSLVQLFILPTVAALISIAIGIGCSMMLSNILVSKANIIIVIIIVFISYLILILKLKVLNEEDIIMLPKGDKLLKILKNRKGKRNVK